MRVAVVAEQLRRRVPGGVGTYAHGLLLGLGRLNGQRADITVYASRARDAPDPLGAYGFPVRTSLLPSRGLTRAWDWGVARSPSGADVVHDVSLATAPTRHGQRLTVMVHDLSWRQVPEAFPARGRRWHESALRRAVRRSDLLIVPSESTAAALRAACGPGAPRIEVIEEGCDHLPPPDAAAATA
ncbi:MAG TPA: glycosyltransferase, partial [Acidimicrobiales bacterium]|nr:glycosyltransferase [Acidimicrobiales bacterium]